MHRPGDPFSLHEMPDASGWLARLDVRVKLVVCLAMVAAVVASTGAGLPLVAAACALGILVASGTPLGMVAGRFAAPLGLVLVIGVIQSVMTEGTAAFSLGIGSWQVAVTHEGLRDAARVGSRVLGSLLAVLVLGLSTDAPELFAALRWMKMPRTLVEISMLMHRYLFLLGDQATSAVSAQRVRLGYARWSTSIQSMGSLAGVVLLRAFDQAQRTHEAMVARGFCGTLPLASLPAMSRKDRILTLVAVGGIALVYALAEG